MKTELLPTKKVIGLLSTLLFFLAFSMNVYSLCSSYCDAYSWYGDWDDYINGVMIGDINNWSSYGYGVNDYTDQSTEMQGDNTYDLTVYMAYQYGHDVTVFIDWNQDCDFDDEYEQQGLSTDDYYKYYGGIYCPPDAVPGQTRMRIRSYYYWDPNYSGACWGTYYGEIEDYSINVILPLKLETGTVTPTQFCKNDFLTVSYKILNGFTKPDNVFKIELSDEYGNFGSPRVIGQLQTTVGGTINCQLPDNALPASSNYQVRVIATNPASTGTASATILTVNPSPYVFNVIGENGYCANAKVGSAIGIDDTEKYTYYQLYRDGVKVGVPVAGTDQPISFGKFTNVGKYQVEAVSPFGCKNWMLGQVDVVIIPLPLAYNMTGGGIFFDQPGPGTYCEGSDGVAIGLSKGDIGVNYQLKLNGNDVSVPIQGRGDKISFGYYTEEGTYIIKALSIKGGCLNDMVGSITVKKLPTPAVYDVQSTGGFCEGTAGVEIKLSKSDVGFSYQMFYNSKSLGSPKAGTGAPLSFGLFNKTGTYTVLATNTSSGCNKYMKGIVNLSPVPSPAIYDVSGQGKFCEGDDGAVITLSKSSTDAVYELYNNNTATGNKLVGTGSELTFNPVAIDGNYTVVATTIKGGCSLPMNGIVQVTMIPLPNATIRGNKTPGMNTFEKYSIEQPQENETYLWKSSNGEIIGSNTASEITVNWGDKKTGTVELYRKNGWGCSNWEILKVDLNNVLSAEFTSKQVKGDVPFLVEFTNNSTGFVSSYFWEFGDGGTSPQVNPSHTYKQVGKYSVKLTIAHENDSKTITKADYVTVLPPNSVEEDGLSFNSNKTASISLIEPNPAKNEIRFDYFLSIDQNIDLAVFDALGNKVLSITSGIVPQGTQNMSVDISKLTSGNYYLQLSTKDGNVTKHFSIVK